MRLLGRILIVGAMPCIALPALAQFDNVVPYSVRNQARQVMPTQFEGPPGMRGLQKPSTASMQRKDLSFDDLFPRQQFTSSFVEPAELGGVKVPGLNQRSVKLLGQTRFVVVTNSPYSNMADLYRDNRLKGKSNYVTADCILHAYFAYSNAVIAQCVQDHIVPELVPLLSAMLKTSTQDYKNADDAAVRDDIQRNIAFLLVGIKLLDPAVKLPVPGEAAAMVEQELALIKTGRPARSVIFECDEDYSAYQPYGMYAARPVLQNYFRSRQWLSRMYLPLTDSSDDTRGASNSFRRSVLLFRSIRLATISGMPALDYWKKLCAAMVLISPVSQDFTTHTLLPMDYEPLFQSNDLQVTLSSLAEPLTRTKLLLSLRKQKPVELGSTSIFDLKSANKANAGRAVFRFLPSVEDPEWDCLRQQAKVFTDENSNETVVPIGLLEMHALGSGQANNILADNSQRLNQDLLRTVPALDQAVRNKDQANNSVLASRCKMLTPYFNPIMLDHQKVMGTTLYLTRRLESALAAWLDSHIALGSLKPPPPPEDESTNPGAPQTTVSKPATFHYLEPSPQIFERMKLDEQFLEENLTQLGMFPEQFRPRSGDFRRLSSRLASIAVKEVNSEPVDATDMKLLGGIDMILQQVTTPVPGSIYLNSGAASSPAVGNAGGASLGVGKPGFLYIILETPKGGITLGRGAVYTYYETPGGPIRADHWLRKLDFAMVKTPSWTRGFDVVQEEQLRSSQ